MRVSARSAPPRVAWLSSDECNGPPSCRSGRGPKAGVRSGSPSRRRRRRHLEPQSFNGAVATGRAPTPSPPSSPVANAGRGRGRQRPVDTASLTAAGALRVPSTARIEWGAPPATTGAGSSPSPHASTNSQQRLPDPGAAPGRHPRRRLPHLEAPRSPSQPGGVEGIAILAPCVDWRQPIEYVEETQRPAPWSRAAGLHGRARLRRVADSTGEPLPDVAPALLEGESSVWDGLAAHPPVPRCLGQLRPGQRAQRRRGPHRLVAEHLSGRQGGKHAVPRPGPRRAPRPSPGSGPPPPVLDPGRHHLV